MTTLSPRPVLVVGLCLLQVLCVSARSFIKGEPFQSWKAPEETITNYEVVTPAVRASSGDHTHEVHSSRLEVSLGDYVLHLELNKGLFPAHFTSRYFDQNDNEIIERGHVNCFYQGWVEDHPDWRVTMSTCHGLQGSFGNLGNSEEYYHVEPIQPFPNSLEVPHALYLGTEYTIARGNCGSKQHHSEGQDPSFHVILPDKDLTSSRLRRQTSNGFRIVEWALVNDFRQFQTFDGNLTATVLRDLEIANFVDSLYQDLQVDVVLVDATTWTNGDLITVVSNPNTLLDNFEVYKPQIDVRHDSAMLITGIDLDGNTVGLAYIGTMCNQLISIGLSQDSRSGVDSVGSTAAHELGHIFGMNHDDDPQRSCVCNDPTDTCIMASISGNPPPTQWSDCSRADLSNGFTNRNLDRCLFNEPSRTVGDPFCGNGIREGDETCDCGTLEECQNPCCNATTCTLIAGATCDTGLCCENCQLKSYGSTCREAVGECDVLEYCSGEDSDCPIDLGVQNGLSCNNNQSYCFYGSCQTYDAQCLYHWGEGSSMSEQLCYDSLNVRGDRAGSCGYSDGNFVGCSGANVLCGQLQCASGTFQNTVSGVSTFIQRFRTPSGTIIDCYSFAHANPPTDLMHPGLVQDGTRCGDDRLCFMAECVNVSSVASIQPCPIGPNGETCSDNGICNNLNQCSCSVGFNGVSCQNVYTGPGSGGASNTNAGAIAGAVIGTLIGLAVLTGVIVGLAIFCVKKKPLQKYKYTPPQVTKSSPRTTHSTTNRASGGSPSVSVVQPGGRHQAPSKPVKPDVSQHHGVSRPPPPSLTAKRPPPAPSKPAPPVGYHPPQHKAVKPPAPQKPSPAPRPQVAPRSTQPPRQWPPPSANSDSPPARPPVPVKKRTNPPRY